MPRTNATNVKKVLVSSGVSIGDADLGVYIDTATTIVDDHCTASGYSSTRLELIERWLAAHFYVLDDKRVIQEGVATGPHQQFQFYKVDVGLDNTQYGQTAKRLDPKANLAAFENSLKEVKKDLEPAGESGGPRTKWLGTPLR